MYDGVHKVYPLEYLCFVCIIYYQILYKYFPEEMKELYFAQARTL